MKKSMKKPSRVLHQYWQDPIYWSIVSRMSTIPNYSQYRIRFDSGIPKSKKYIDDIIYCHKEILGLKNMSETEIFTNLLMPPKNDFDFLKEYKESREV